MPALKRSLSLPDGWNDVSPSEQSCITLCKLASNACSSSAPVNLTHTIKICEDRSWSITVLGNKVDVAACKVLKKVPPILGRNTVNLLINLVDSSCICTGNDDEKYVKVVAQRKEKQIKSSNGSMAAYFDQKANTVRAKKCEILTSEGRCDQCVNYRDTLRKESLSFLTHQHLVILT